MFSPVLNQATILVDFTDMIVMLLPRGECTVNLSSTYEGLSRILDDSIVDCHRETVTLTVCIFCGLTLTHDGSITSHHHHSNKREQLEGSRLILIKLSMSQKKLYGKEQRWYEYFYSYC